MLVLAAGTTALHGQVNGDWAELLNTNMERWNPNETVLNVDNAGNLGLRWSYYTAVNAVYSSPAVVNGVVYIASEAGNVYALNAFTGGLIWNYAPGSGVNSSPAVANGMVYFGTQDGTVYGLNADTGVKIWSFNSGGFVNFVDSSPAVANGTVYFGSGDHNVYALDAKTGVKLWSYTTGWYVQSSPAVANGVVYVGSDDFHLYALDANTGSKLWSYATGGPITSSPAVANGVVYIGSDDGSVYALKADTGTKIWTFTGGIQLSVPALANGMVYICQHFDDPRRPGTVFALDANTGIKRWSYVPGGSASMAAVANGVLYVGSGDYNVYALNANTGTKLWSYNTGNYVVSPVVVSNGVVYVGSRDGRIYAFSIPDSGTPAVKLTPSYLAFPSAGGTLPVTVTNAGNGDLNLTEAPTIIGTNANDFAVVNGTTCVRGFTISKGNTCTVEVAFTPSNESWEVATLELLDNASYGPQTVPLSGGGQLISISPNPVPGSGSAQIVTITGTNFENGAKINWQDLTTPAWTGTVTPESISSNSITASMNFTDASATWQIAVVNPGQAKNSPNRTSNWYTFQVLGTDETTLSSSLLDDYPFKNAPVDALDPYDFAFDECTSYVAWRINRDNGTPDPNNPSFFKKMAGGNWGSALNWGLNAGFLHYSQNPKPQVGDIAQWTKINHVAYVERVNNPDGSIDVSEYNYGSDNGGIKYEYGVRNVPPKSFPDMFIHVSRLSLSPTSLDFGMTGISRSNSGKVVVTNSLAQAISPVVTLGVSEASIVTNNSADTGDFIETDTCTGQSLLPNEQCEITVTFMPPVSLIKGGAKSAAINLNWGAGPQLIPVHGIALTNLNPSPKTLSFGKVPVGETSAARTVKLTNNTGADVTIASISSGPEFNATGCNAPLVNGSSCNVSVTFSPTTRGQQSTTLTITDTAVNSPQTVTLKGTGK